MKISIIRSVGSLLLFSNIFFISCNKSIINENNTTDFEIKEVAASYNYTVEDLKPNTYKVTTIKELKKVLQEFKNYKESLHVQQLVEGNQNHLEMNTLDIKKEMSKIETQSKFLHTEKIKVHSFSIDDGPNDGAIGYKYSKIYYMKGSGSTPSYYIRIDYNTDGKGHFSGDPSITTGIYGSTIATYTQIGFNFFITPNGSLVFEVTGVNKVNYSIQGYTLSDGTIATFTGYVNLLQPASSGTSLDFGQFTGGAIWWTLTAPTKAIK
jgi:hypothetical protein